MPNPSRAPSCKSVKPSWSRHAPAFPANVPVGIIPWDPALFVLTQREPHIFQGHGIKVYIRFPGGKYFIDPESRRGKRAKVALQGECILSAIQVMKRMAIEKLGQIGFLVDNMFAG